MKKNYIFNIEKTNIEKENGVELFFQEHSEEVKERIIQSFLLIFFFMILSFLNINLIVKILQTPISNLKFFQLSPGEYFLSTFETAIFFGLVVASPIFVNQLMFFLFPGLSNEEQLIIPFLTTSSIILFFLSLNFSYFILIPLTLGFFVNYSKNSIEPLLSYNQYVSFVGVIFFSNGILFQVPILQIIFSVVNILSGQKMLKNWKPILMVATIISAICTPSADPFTQLLLASVIILLYMGGAFVSSLLEPIK